MPTPLIAQFVNAASRFPREINALSPWQIVGQIDALIHEALQRLPMISAGPARSPYIARPKWPIPPCWPAR